MLSGGQKQRTEIRFLLFDIRVFPIKIITAIFLNSLMNIKYVFCIVIARAMLKKPTILILDEATSE